MKKKILRFLFDRFKSTFVDFLVYDFIDEMPEEVKEPSLTFLANGKSKLEKWIFFQVHFVLRRMTRDEKNADFYRGMLVYLKVFQTYINQPVAKTPTYGSPTPDKEQRDPVQGVEDFITGLREKKNVAKETAENTRVKSRKGKVSKSTVVQVQGSEDGASGTS